MAIKGAKTSRWELLSSCQGSNVLTNINQNLEENEKYIFMLDGTGVVSEHNKQHFNRYNDVQEWIDGSEYEKKAFDYGDNLCHGV